MKNLMRKGLSIILLALTTVGCSPSHNGDASHSGVVVGNPITVTAELARFIRSYENAGASLCPKNETLFKEWFKLVLKSQTLAHSIPFIHSTANTIDEALAKEQAGEVSYSGITACEWSKMAETISSFILSNSGTPNGGYKLIVCDERIVDDNLILVSLEEVLGPSLVSTLSGSDAEAIINSNSELDSSCYEPFYQFYKPGWPKH